MKKIIMMFFLAALALPAYSRDNPRDKPQDKFVPGQVCVSFVDAIEGAGAIEILKNNGLEPGRVIIPRISYHFSFLGGNPLWLKEKLDKSLLFDEVGVRFSPDGAASKVLYANTKLTATKYDVESLVASLGNVKIDAFYVSNIVVLVNVPEGKELLYIKKLKDNPWVQDAELNAVVEAADEVPAD